MFIWTFKSVPPFKIDHHYIIVVVIIIVIIIIITPDRRQSKILLTIHECGSKIARINSIFDLTIFDLPSLIVLTFSIAIYPEWSSKYIYFIQAIYVNPLLLLWLEEDKTSSPPSPFRVVSIIIDGKFHQIESKDSSGAFSLYGDVH